MGIERFQPQFLYIAYTKDSRSLHMYPLPLTCQGLTDLQ